MNEARLRIDKWLWHARFFKSRSLAARACAARRVRLNRAIVSKAHAMVKPDDVLTFAQGGRIRVIRVRALATRRGPAPEARALYDDLDPLAPRARAPQPAAGARRHGAGRPTKADARAIARLRDAP